MSAFMNIGLRKIIFDVNSLLCSGIPLNIIALFILGASIGLTLLPTFEALLDTALYAQINLSSNKKLTIKYVRTDVILSL